MSKPLVSYVIPCYNCQTTIFDTVMSIKDTDLLVRHEKELLWPKIEVILVNDGSTDYTLSIIKSLEDEFENVKVIDLGENKGKGIARNTGNKAAKADIIGVLDSDDLHIGDRTGEILKYFKENPDMDVFYSSYKTIHTYNGKEGLFKAKRINPVQLWECGTFAIGHSTVAYTKKAILEQPYSEDKNKDDWQMLWNFYTNKYKFRYSTKPLIAYKITQEDIEKMYTPGLEEHLLEKKQKIMKPYFDKLEVEANVTNES